jgi:Ca-activated chloride channel family protein
VFCVGIGNEVNRPLLTQLANEAGGLAAFASQGDNFERQAQAFRRKLMRPAVSNLKLSFDGGSVYDIEPETLPNLYHGMPLRIYGRYRQAGVTNVTIKGDVQGQPFEQSVKVELPAKDDANPEIERMWAWKRVDQLLATARERGETDTVRNEIVQLCEEFSITSEYASFIVLENDGEYQRWKIERKNVHRLERDRAAQAEVKRELEVLRDKALSKLGPATDGDRKPVVNSTAVTLPIDPTINTAQQTLPNGPAPSQIPSAPARRGFDLHLPGASGGGGGGGAIDPLSAAIGLSLAGASALASRKRRKPASESEAK